ncbi:MAG: hypothetical protein WCH93_08460 [Actinomycetota bacterium]
MNPKLAQMPHEQRTRRSGRWLASMVVPIAALALAACGSTSSAPTTAVTPTTVVSAATGGAHLALAASSLGQILVDGSGRTVYLFTNDEGTVSSCLGGCVSNWPPVIASAAPTFGDGLDAGDFGTTTRPDGTVQVTFYGHPLYTFAGDSQVGDVNGEGVSSVWWVIDAAGNAIKR